MINNSFAKVRQVSHSSKHFTKKHPPRSTMTVRGIDRLADYTIGFTYFSLNLLPAIDDIGFYNTDDVDYVGGTVNECVRRTPSCFRMVQVIASL